MTYADQCLEMAQNADPGTTWQWTLNKLKPNNAVFIDHAREDILELARRLKEAIYLVKQAFYAGNLTINYSPELYKKLDELEAPLGDK